MIQEMTQKTAKKWLLESLNRIQDGYLELVCPKETHVFGKPGSALKAMAVVHDERFFTRAVIGADVGMGESFMEGDWTTPDLVSLVRIAVRNIRLLDASHPIASLVRGLMSRAGHRLRGNSLKGSSRNIKYHYDLGNQFYRLFLDERMNYSCAIFGEPDESLEAAQLRKLDGICRKLQLQPGDKVLEIGCGWGAFALHAAKYYGARVTGLTLSPAQFEYAAQLAAGTPVGKGSVEIRLEDYRKTSGKFDKIVSIEMFEAVGLDRYDEFFGACDRLLTADGTMLLQTITLREQEMAAYRKRVDWIQTYIFPGSDLASLAGIYRSLGRATDISVSHQENFGGHYAQTVAAWRGRFFRNLEQVRRLGYDEKFQRMWDFYLGWCEGAFRERYINVAQLLLAKNSVRRKLPGDPIESEKPLSRAAIA
jgi:cyclopropane-fatty-acyl-phospholipid synthase